ncbi:LuxR C-terminal-related transcriptional regulator [Poseidonocella sedimentorum]|uniref:DNA-binding transcriptional regulator, CsgD family n=1 Tax=Poseidonocella sedimentorum TaxID=871652 RepID=A0A1I6ERH3_9RHOB|nr:LuxR C-terminal-related transcriptional regulator [Poseidonocella sedimentorum]SFR20396.1 DNA-binding transcriptional regulator, CsgD family [Poseidonocella sedimentorum]
MTTAEHSQALHASEAEVALAVIAAETTCFAAGDFAGWADCWVQDARTRETCVSARLGSTVLEGWDTIERYMRGVFDRGAICAIAGFERHNLSLTFSGDLAFISFNGRAYQTDGRIEHTFETRVLERGASGWRILSSSFVLRGPQGDETDRLAVDGRGRVLASSETALQRLQAHPALTLSHGRLRAARPEWDQRLQAALACAAEQHGYFEHYHHAAQSGRPCRLPVVLGETDSGSVAFCTLTVRDDMTFVDIQNDAALDDRLTLARAIYGLSESQCALAARIVAGDSLGAAADQLGISVNTVRTHLSRIYVKTGVSSQTALVRALLSVG